MLNSTFLKCSLLYQAKSLCSAILSPTKLVRHYTIRRAVLYIPGHEERKIEKALSIRVDCLAFDLQNIHTDVKKQARIIVNNLLSKSNVTKSDPEWCVKVNPIDTGYEFQEDINAILSAKSLPAAIALPGVHTCDHLQFFTEKIWEKLTERPEDDRGPLSLLLVVGSARGVLRLSDICQKAEELATMAPILPSALIFDNDSLTQSLGGTKTNHGVELMYAKQKVVLVAKAFGLQVIDIPNLNPHGLREVQNECTEAAIMGFTGKQVIYPAHVPVVQNEFNPSRSKIRAAKMTITQFNKNEENKPEELERIPGDLAFMKVAEHTIHVAKFIGKIDE